MPSAGGSKLAGQPDASRFCAAKAANIQKDMIGVTYVRRRVVEPEVMTGIALIVILETANN